MKKITLIAFLLILPSCLIGAGENSDIQVSKDKYFPEISGINLEGKEKKLPAAFDNKLNIVVVAFKREQQVEVDSWIKALEPVLKENPELSFYEIPVIYELSSFSRMWINNGMRFGIPDSTARKRTITVYTKREKFFEVTGMKEDNIYALLINSSGKILWRMEGVADAKKIRSLKKMFN